MNKRFEQLESDRKLLASAGLTKLEIQQLAAWIFDSYSQVEIAEIRGVSKQNVNSALKRAIEKLVAVGIAPERLTRKICKDRPKLYLFSEFGSFENQVRRKF